MCSSNYTFWDLQIPVSFNNFQNRYSRTDELLGESVLYDLNPCTLARLFFLSFYHSSDDGIPIDHFKKNSFVPKHFSLYYEPFSAGIIYTDLFTGIVETVRLVKGKQYLMLVFFHKIYQLVVTFHKT